MRVGGCLLWFCSGWSGVMRVLVVLSALFWLVLVAGGFFENFGSHSFIIDYFITHGPGSHGRAKAVYVTCHCARAGWQHFSDF